MGAYTVKQYLTLKGIIDYDCTNYKVPTVTLEFPICDFKCDKLNGKPVCQNGALAAAPNIEIHEQDIWKMYQENPLTQAFCIQGLEPFDTESQLLDFIEFIRYGVNCNDPIVIYTGYNKDEIKCLDLLQDYGNIIIKYGRFIMNQEPHYDAVLGVKLASDNQYAEQL